MLQKLSWLLVGLLPLMATAKTLETPQGTLVGAPSPDNDAVMVYKSIPYALPPVGVRRWQHAESAPDWEGERLATDFSPVCVQRPYPAGSFFARPGRPQSEDCLYLNVWTGAKPDEKRPVMVWIHGGALTRGTGATAAYDGTNLAGQGVVLITINYRVDLFGYFHHPELKNSEGQPLANFGTTDQVTALKWVADNVAAFGGDPDNVTIFGESAGAFSVNHLMASPLAKDLFHKAIAQSGAAMGAMADARDPQSPVYEQPRQLENKLGVKGLDDLKAVDAASLLDAAGGMRFRPVVDGVVFPQLIRKQFESGNFNQVPLLAGFNAHEGTTLGVTYRVPKTEAAYRTMVEQRFGDLAGEYLKIYPASDLRGSTLDAFRDGFVTAPMQTWAMHVSAQGQPSYLYYFSYEPAGPELGAYHAAEIVYAFDTVAKVNPRAKSADRKLADLMSAYWVNFASDGDPNGKGLPKWRPYEKDARHYMEFDGKARPGKDLLPGIWEFHEKLRLSRR